MKTRERLSFGAATDVYASNGVDYDTDILEVSSMTQGEERAASNTVELRLAELLDYQQTSDDYDPAIAWGLLESIKEWQEAAPEWRVDHVAAAIQVEVDHVSASWRQAEDNQAMSAENNEIIIRARMIDELLTYLDMNLVAVDDEVLKQSRIPQRFKKILHSVTPGDKSVDDDQASRRRNLKVWSNKQLAATGLSVVALTTLGMNQAYATAPSPTPVNSVQSPESNTAHMPASVESLLSDALPLRGQRDFQTFIPKPKPEKQVHQQKPEQKQPHLLNQDNQNKENDNSKQEEYHKRVVRYAEAIVYLQNNDGVAGDDLNSINDTLGGLKVTEWATIFVDAADKYGGGVVTPGLLIAQVKQESGFDSRAVSYAAAKGPCQFIDGAWSRWGEGRDVYNPHDCIPAQARYMSYIYENYVKGNYPSAELTRKMTEAGYNAGEGSITRYGTELLKGTLSGYEQTKPYTILIEKSLRTLQKSIDASIAREVSSRPSMPSPTPPPTESTPRPKHKSSIDRIKPLSKNSPFSALYKVPDGGDGHDVYYGNQRYDLGGIDGMDPKVICGIASSSMLISSLNNNPDLSVRDLHQGALASGAFDDRRGVLSVDKLLGFLDDTYGLDHHTILRERTTPVDGSVMDSVDDALGKHELILVHTSDQISGRLGGHTDYGHYFVMYATADGDYYVVNPAGKSASDNGFPFTRAQIEKWADGFYAVGNGHTSASYNPAAIDSSSIDKLLTNPIMVDVQPPTPSNDHNKAAKKSSRPSESKPTPTETTPPILDAPIPIDNAPTESPVEPSNSNSAETPPIKDTEKAPHESPPTSSSGTPEVSTPSPAPSDSGQNAGEANLGIGKNLGSELNHPIAIDGNQTDASSGKHDDNNSNSDTPPKHADNPNDQPPVATAPPQNKDHKDTPKSNPKLSAPVKKDDTTGDQNAKMPEQQPTNVMTSEKAKSVCAEVGTTYLGAAEGYEKGVEHGIFICSLPESMGGMKINVEIAPKVVGAINELRQKGISVTVISGYRDNDFQKQLRLQYNCEDPANLKKLPPHQGCSRPVAWPGWSNHQRGLAVDVSSSADYLGIIRQVFAKHGLHNYVADDTNHFSPNGG